MKLTAKFPLISTASHFCLKGTSTPSVWRLNSLFY